jgi:hypothetical protein
MSAYDNYIPINFQTPTKSSRQVTPLTTPTRTAKSNFSIRGSPIKFPFSTPEKETLKEVDFYKDFDDSETNRTRIWWRIVSTVLLWVLWALLVASAIYLFLRI